MIRLLQTKKENFYEELSNHISAYSQGQLYHIMPGEYYAFAKIPETKIYNETFTVINSSALFTVQKSSLTVDESILDNLIGTYGYYIDHLEDITLDNLYFYRSTDNLTGDVLFNLYDKNEEIIPCRVDWVYPDTVINSSNDGYSYAITAVVDEQYRDYYEILHIEKEIKIEVDKLEIGLYFELENSFSADETSGMEYDYIYNIGDSYRIYLNGLHYDYDKVIQIFDNNGNLLEIKKIDVNDYSVEYYVEIEMKNPEQYFIEARLLNKQNSCWDSLDSEPKTFNYEIVAAEVLDVSGEFAVQEFDGNVEGENLPLFVKYMNDWFSTNMAKVASTYTSNVYLTYTSSSYNAKFKIDSSCSFTDISSNKDFNFNFTMNKYTDEEQVEYSGSFNYFENEFMNDVYSQNQLVTSITGYNSIDNLLFKSARIDYPQIVAETENPIYYVATDDNFLKVKTICTWEQNGKNIDCEIILVFDNDGNYIGHQVSYNDGEMSYCLQNKLSYTIL